jgi:hypothetical protein
MLKCFLTRLRLARLTDLPACSPARLPVCPSARLPVCPSARLYIDGVNMMCAFGVPANMIHGAFACGFSLKPVLAPVAYGM